MVRGMKLLLLMALVAVAVAPLAEGPAPASLDPNLEGLRPLLGKTFRGEFKESTPEKPMFDVARYERAMNGFAVRVLHSVNDGAYGGETLIYWDKARKVVAYLYVTTAGFQTSGTLTISKGRFEALEEVVGDANGITKVRSVSELRADGKLAVKSEYFKDGQWSLGREMTYAEAPSAKVVFK